MERALQIGMLASDWEWRLRSKTDIVRGRKTKKSASDSGVTQSARNKGKRTEIRTEMGRLKGNGHSTANAARLAHDLGIGSSADANRKIWNRHSPR